MKTIRAFIKRHPLLTYFFLTFVISWGGILIVVGGPGGIPGTTEQTEMLFPFALLVLEIGPPIAGLVLTGLVSGRAGFRDLLTRMTRWRLSARWYAVALLTAPLLVTAILLALALTSPEFLPGILTTSDKASLLLMGIAGGLIGGGFSEELGWTGFAVPKLRRRYGVLSTGLIVGLLWGAWHLLVQFWASGTSAGALDMALFLPALVFSVAALPAIRVLLVWVYDRTESLLVVMLMHASFTASLVILQPLATGAPALIYNLVLAAALWVLVAAVAVANRGHLSRQPLPTPVA